MKKATGRKNQEHQARIAPSTLDEMEAMKRYPGFRRSLSLQQSMLAKQYRDLTKEEEEENNAPRTRFRVAAIMEAQDQHLSRSIQAIRNRGEAAWAFDAAEADEGRSDLTVTTNRKKAVAKPRAVSPSEHSCKVEEVVVRYQNGHAVAIVYPPHLSCLTCEPPKPVNRGGRPSAENNVRYVLNRTISNLLSVPKPAPVTRYGLTKLAVAWCDKERDDINGSTAPKWDKDKRLAWIVVSRDSIDRFAKRYFKRPGQRLSPKDLRRIFPDLWYT